MNKTLLLILCDFLLLTLLSLVNWEEEKAESSSSDIEDTVDQSVSAMAMMEQDLLDTLASALEEEKTIQNTLESEADKVRKELELRDQKLQEKESSIMDLETSIQEAETREETLAQEKMAIEAEALKAKESIVTLENIYEDLELKSKQMEAQARMLQAELEEKQKEIDAKLAALAREELERKEAEEKVQELSIKVSVTEEQKKMLAESVETLKSEVFAERTERLQLQAQTTQMAEGITQLAERSQDLTEEFRSSQPINANILFSRFNENKIAITFKSNRFYRGESIQDDDLAMTLLISDGKNVFALTHLSSTPLGASNSSLGFRELEIEMSRGVAELNPSQLTFLALDPRIASVPLTDDQVGVLGGEIFYTALDPFKFSEAVLIDEKGSYYGEVEFKLDARTPGYVRMQSKIFSRIFGDFSPTKGDLVFSKTGELLGIMVDSRYCLLVDNLMGNERLSLGAGFSSDQFKATIQSLKNRYDSLPSDLR